VGDLAGMIDVLPVELVDKIGDLVLILQAAGVAAIIYVIYVIGMGIFSYRKMKKIEKIDGEIVALNKKIDLINRKLNKLTSAKKSRKKR